MGPSEGSATGQRSKLEGTHRAIAADACPPCRGRVDNAEVGPDAVRACGGLGLEMGRGRLCALDLDETLGADRLAAAARVVDVRGIILRSNGSERVSDTVHTSARNGRGGKRRTMKQMGHSAAPRYSAASFSRLASFPADVARLWCARLELECVDSARTLAPSAGAPSGSGGSFLCARICSSSQSSS